MLTLIFGLGFIMLGILPYGVLNVQLLKNCQNFQDREHQV